MEIQDDPMFPEDEMEAQLGTEGETMEDDMTSLPTEPMQEELAPYISPTLASIDARARPDPSTVCEVCPASVWLNSPAGLKCYCRVMHLVTWSTEEPNDLTHCDGEIMANLERLRNAST